MANGIDILLEWNLGPCVFNHFCTGVTSHVYSIQTKNTLNFSKFPMAFPFIQRVCHSCHRASWRSNATTCCINITESHSTWWFQPPLFRKKTCSTAWVHLFSSFRRMATYLGSSAFSTQRLCPDPHVPNQQMIPNQRMPTIPDRYLSAKSWWWWNQPNWTICASQNGFIFTKYRWTQKIFELPPRNFRIPTRFGSFPGNSNRNCRGYTASEGHAGLHLETELIHGLIQQKISLLHHPIILCWRFTSDAHLCLYISIWHELWDLTNKISLKEKADSGCNQRPFVEEIPHPVRNEVKNDPKLKSGTIRSWSPLQHFQALSLLPYSRLYCNGTLSLALIRSNYSGVTRPHPKR